MVSVWVSRRVWITEPALQNAAPMAKIAADGAGRHRGVLLDGSNCGASITSTPMNPTITADQR